MEGVGGEGGHKHVWSYKKLQRTLKPQDWAVGYTHYVALLPRNVRAREKSTGHNKEETPKVGDLVM